MANIKVSQLGAVTTPASADLMIIVDDSEASVEQTKQITWANIKAALTGASAQYTTTGSYYAVMPSNSVAANARVMLGDTNTVCWFYVNTAPPGWKVAPTLAGDRVLSVSGGTESYNINGGNAGGTWTVAGLSMAHTHTGPSHTHTVSGQTVDTSHTHGVGAEGGANTGFQKGAFHTDDGGSATDAVSAVSTGAEGTGNTGAASTSAVASTAAWRPAAYVGKLFQLDLA